MNRTPHGRRRQSAVGLLLWPMAAVYALLLAQPAGLWEWFMYTLAAAVALIPPGLLGYTMGRMESDPS